MVLRGLYPSSGSDFTINEPAEFLSAHIPALPFTFCILSGQPYASL
jgi:hypothetical protein